MVANVDELWRALSRTDEMPVEAIKASLANWDEVSDRFLSKLRVQAGGGRLSDSDRDALFVAIHLFAEKGDVRAYAPLCTEIAKDFEGDSRLGEAMQETLTQMLISLFDGDTGPLRAVAEASNADAVARTAAFKALGYLTRTREDVPREATHDFLRDFGQALTDAEDPIIGWGWALVVAALGFDDLGPEVARAISRNAVDADFYDIKDFHEDLRLARQDADGLAVFRNYGAEPFGSAIDQLSVFEWGVEKEAIIWDRDDDLDDPAIKAEPYAAFTPHVNPLRDVGRNDPCPCGSSKKYKKCCLAA